MANFDYAHRTSFEDLEYLGHGPPLSVVVLSIYLMAVIVLVVARMLISASTCFTNFQSVSSSPLSSHTPRHLGSTSICRLLWLTSRIPSLQLGHISRGMILSPCFIACEMQLGWRRQGLDRQEPRTGRRAPGIDFLVSPFPPLSVISINVEIGQCRSTGWRSGNSVCIV